MEPDRNFLSSPHIRAPEDTRSVMLDVIIALLPALAFSVYYFGWRSLTLTVFTVLCCLFFEWLYRRLLKKSLTLRDLSAVVTGILLALCLPVTAPYWVAAVGAAFAILVVKQLYGGLGKNFLNPALAARAFLFSWPSVMTTWAVPMSRSSILGASADAVTGATPMTFLHAGTLPKGVELYQMLMGQRGGSLGETSALLLLLGGAYLVVRRVIPLRIPVAFLGTAALLTLLFPRGNSPLEWMLYSLMGGGMLLGAIFMATDPATSPVTAAGQWIYGALCGALTVFFRYFGAYPEGVAYAILISNASVWIIERGTFPRRFGTKRRSWKKAGAPK
ncbi:RnfABCDGE type electron transport complex subunit D [Papillibacter cinnamivorans]|uniref:Ion-translocating oxidoreductase complex subunit D n=1 Tax=Papillibacter cinnamivorans DSM 12816 TaxID=1122930 RepID=A0A1W2BIF9_9FIRM|nr:RnfABCDGE type electron transport complex subunit D [Papillibacter cinnamivorans]SMC72676.1 electron transport complex protein RnfD [Papillibacter cinnamivorans DSM 12816]